MKIIPNWRDSWKWFSVHVAAFQIVFGGLQLSLLQYARPVMSPSRFAFIMIMLSVLMIVARLIDQKGDHNAD